MNATIQWTNEVGSAFVEFALPMLIQSGLLILILLLVDLLLRKRVRAVFRYWIWMLVLVKLLLPTSLSSPVSVGCWFGDELAYVDLAPAPTAAPKVDVTPVVVTEAPPVTEVGRVETTATAPAVAVEPTAHPLEPAATETINPISPPSPAVTPLSWQAMVLLVWLAVVAAMGLLLLQRALFVRRLVAQAAKANRPMKERLAHCCQRMAVKRGIDLKISASATSPAVCGLFNPVILVPENLAPSLSSGELRVILLHELAHIKRGDLWVNLAATILQILYFYNPLLWLANAMIRRAREQAVDEMVLVAMGDNARQYPQTLLSVAKMAFKRPALSLRLTGVVESRSALTGRMKHILNRPMPKTAKLGFIGLVVVIAAAAVLLPMAAFVPGPPELVVKGTVRDPQTGEPIAGARVFDDSYGPTPAWDQIRAGERSEWGAITNAAGEYSFLTWPEHHSISAQAPGYISGRESLYEDHFTINDNDEETMNFLLEPDAVSGPASAWSEMSQSDLNGRIIDPAGSPVAGAQVALCTDKIGARMSHGKLEPIRSEVGSSIVRTDDEGRFTLGQRPADSFILIVADDSGFALVRAGEYADSSEIKLQRWGRIEGQVARGRTVAGDKIWMSSLPNSTWFRHKREYRYETECDAEGRFVFEKVPAGWFEAGYLIRTGDNGWSITSRTPVEVAAGETAEITLGGSGRPVVGMFLTPASYDKSIYFGNGLRALSRTRPDEPRPGDYDRMTKREQQRWRTQWRKTDQYRQYSDAYWHDPNWRHYTFRINDDGSFRIEDVIPGKYDLTVWIEERLTGRGRPEEIGGYYGSIEVPEMPGGRSDEPLDLGELELSMHEPLRVGDVAPLFEAKTLDGKDLKLIDYRGKFVLLSFWQPVSHPELERLKILAAGYNAVGRLEIVGLGGNDTLEEVKRYVEENDIPWPQIFTGEDFRSGIAKDYRIPGVPWIFLIGPDGRIAANGLRGEKLSSTVLEALDSTEQNGTEAPAPFSRDKVTDIRLPFTFTIYTVTPDNKPQPGVKVRCLHPRPERAEPTVDMVVESDEDGVAEFTITKADLLTDWMYWFSLDDEDFVGAPGVGITPDEGDWTFKVLPAERFALNVVGDKKPVSGATVHLQIDHGEGKDWDPKRFWAYESVVTDSAGRARVNFVKGKISMTIAAKGYAPKTISEVELSTEKPYQIELAKGRDITGRVVDPNDEPLASVTVTAKSKGDLPWDEEFLLKASTDQKGNFTLGNASAGKWEVMARSEDPNKPYFIAPVTVNVRSWWRVKPVKMVAEEGFRLKGKYVTDYRINLRRDGGLPPIHVGVTKPSSSWMEFRTKKDGTFDIWGLPCQGQGSIRFVGVGGYHNFVEVPREYDCFQLFGDRLNFRNIPPATYENIKVHYVLAGMVRGTVVDAAAVSFPGAEITVEPEGTRHKTDEEGKFSIRVAPGDALTLTVRDTQTGAIVFTTEPFSVKEGEVIEKNITTRYERRN